MFGLGVGGTEEKEPLRWIKQNIILCLSPVVFKDATRSCCVSQETSGVVPAPSLLPCVQLQQTGSSTGWRVTLWLYDVDPSCSMRLFVTSHGLQTCLILSSFVFEWPLWRETSGGRSELKFDVAWRYRCFNEESSSRRRKWKRLFEGTRHLFDWRLCDELEETNLSVSFVCIIWSFKEALIALVHAKRHYKVKADLHILMD